MITQVSNTLLTKLKTIVEGERRVIPESLVIEGLSGEPAEEVRAALTELWTKGRILKWKHKGDDVTGWSSIFEALKSEHDANWTILTDPVDDEVLQSELLKMDPLGFKEFLESILRFSGDFPKVTWAGVDVPYDFKAQSQSGTDIYLIAKRLRTATEARIREALDARRSILAQDPQGTVIFAIPGLLTERAAALAASHGLTVWDRRALSERTPARIL